MFMNQNFHHFNEFYEGLQDNNNMENYEQFGRQADVSRGSKSTKGFKKITSVQSFNGAQRGNGSIKKSSSSNTFTGNDVDSAHYGRTVHNFRLNDESTRESHSPFSSITSLSSAGSMQTLSQKVSAAKIQGKKKIPTEQDFKTKYKTEVCRYWAERGYCEFGESCAFAHGGAEVRQKSFVPQNFKTKRCVSYHETGYCIYGVRCQFLHCYRKDCHLNPRLMYANYNDDVENVETWITEDQDCFCLKRLTRPRLPVFQDLALERV